jgi:hypothetical protein
MNRQATRRTGLKAIARGKRLAVLVSALGAAVIGCANGSGNDAVDLLAPPPHNTQTSDAAAGNDTGSAPPSSYDSAPPPSYDSAPPAQDAAVAGCSAGETMCNGTCTNLLTDPDNCGMCNSACSGSSTCGNGSCSQPMCSGGETNCGGTCVDTQTDPNNCGACANSCTGTCSNGMCATGGGGGSCGAPEGSCSHGLCSTGAALQDGCDPDGCTFSMCDPNSQYEVDPYCCNTKWDSQCVQEVEELIQAQGCGS